MGYANKDFAILIRQNSLSRNFESKLSGLGMKYRILGGFKFFDRKEIQDVIAYMRVIYNVKGLRGNTPNNQLPAKGHRGFEHRPPGAEYARMRA